MSSTPDFFFLIAVLFSFFKFIFILFHFIVFYFIYLFIYFWCATEKRVRSVEQRNNTRYTVHITISAKLEKFLLFRSYLAFWRLRTLFSLLSLSSKLYGKKQQQQQQKKKQDERRLNSSWCMNKSHFIFKNSSKLK